MQSFKLKKNLAINKCSEGQVFYQEREHSYSTLWEVSTLDKQKTNW